MSIKIDITEGFSLLWKTLHLPCPFFVISMLNSGGLPKLQQQMSDRKLEGAKIIANAYKIIKPLFQVRSYLYAQVCCLKNNYEVASVALYVYENEDPSQTLKMLSEKLELAGKQEHCNLVYPYQHVRDTFNDKNISLFFIRDLLLPFRYYEKRPLSNHQALELLHGALSSLNYLHLRDIVHGNISLSTCYLLREKEGDACKFALNILDTTYFTEEDCFEGIQDRLFESEGQSLGLKVSYKDDLQSLVYVMTHLIGRGKVLTVQRFQLQWITEAQFLRWKTCEFFKEMIKILPPELEVLVEIYNIAKSLRRNQKPDYLKLLKKVIALISDNNSSHSKGSSQERKREYDSGCESVKQEAIVIKMERMKRGKDAVNESSSFSQTKSKQAY